MTGDISDLGQPEPSGAGFGDSVRAALSTGGLFVPPGLTEVDEDLRDWFEIDILAHDFAAGRSLAVEANNGDIQPGDIPKLVGITQYLGTSAGILVGVSGSAGRLIERVNANDRLRALHIGAVEVHACDPVRLRDDLWAGLRRLGHASTHPPRPGPSAEYDTWRHSFWCSRAITERRSLDGLSPETRRRIREWRKLCVENAPLKRDSVSRIRTLYRANAEYGRELHVDVARETGALTPHGRFSDECVNDGEFLAVQHQLLLSLMGRISLLTAMVEAATRFSSAQLEAAARANQLTGWQRERIEALRAVSGVTKIPEVLLRFLLCWGGFWTVNHKDEEQECLAAEAGVDRGLLDAALAQVGMLFWRGESPLYTLGNAVEVYKLVPTQLRGIGLSHRTRRFGIGVEEYVGSGYPGKTCARWARSARALLDSDRNPAAVTSRYRCCA